jgi:integrase
MARIDLPHVQRFKDRHGHLRHYFRKPGCKRTALPGIPGSEEFMEAYKTALGTPNEIGAGKRPPGSVWALVAAFYASREYAAYSPQTRAKFRKILERFRAAKGNNRAAKMEPRHVEDILDQFADRPHMAKDYLKTLRVLFKFAKGRKLVTHNPTADVKVEVRKTGGFRPWDDADIEKFEAFWGEGTRARLALYLLLYTGQRRQDIVKLGRQHMRGSVITFTQLKRGKTQEPVTLSIRLHAKLLAEIARLPLDNMTFLMTEYGKPMSPFGFSNWFADCAKKAGLPEHSSPHGLRKAAARRIAEAGGSSFEVASVTGHTSLKEVERYTRSVRQAHLAASAIDRLEDES